MENAEMSLNFVPDYLRFIWELALAESRSRFYFLHRQVHIYLFSTRLIQPLVIWESPDTKPHSVFAMRCCLPEVTMFFSKSWITWRLLFFSQGYFAKVGDQILAAKNISIDVLKPQSQEIQELWFYGSSFRSTHFRVFRSPSPGWHYHFTSKCTLNNLLMRWALLWAESGLYTESRWLLCVSLSNKGVEKGK